MSHPSAGPLDLQIPEIFTINCGHLTRQNDRPRGDLPEHSIFPRAWSRDRSSPVGKRSPHGQVGNNQLPPTRGQRESSHSPPRRLERRPPFELSALSTSDVGKTSQQAACLQYVSTCAPRSAAKNQPEMLQACVSPYIQHQTPRCGADSGLSPLYMRVRE